PIPRARSPRAPARARRPMRSTAPIRRGRRGRARSLGGDRAGLKSQALQLRRRLLRGFAARKRGRAHAGQVAGDGLGEVRNLRRRELGGDVLRGRERADWDEVFFFRDVLLLRRSGLLRRRLRLEGRGVLAWNAHAHRRRHRARLRIEHHRQDDHREEHQRHGADQPPAATTPERVYVLLLFSHAITSATVRTEPNTTILAPSPARAFAAANASAGESKTETHAESDGSFSTRTEAFAPRGPGSEARCQRVTRGASSRSTAPMSLSRSMP